MPIPIRSRRYDDAFWKEVLGQKAQDEDYDEDKNNAELGF
jgi:hypothetical protein